jgi:hypothetical protein
MYVAFSALRWRAFGEEDAMVTNRQFPQRGALAAALLGACFLPGCATTTVNAEWTDPQFAGRSLRGERVLVVCDASDTAVRRICQDQLAAQVSAAGATPVTGPETAGLTAGPPPANDKTLAAARRAGAKAILAATVAPDATVVSGGSSISFGVGGWGGSGGGVSGGGVGVGVPIGGGQVETAYGANIALTDVATVRLMWTSKVTAPASRNINTQIGEIAKVGIGSARSAGFF